MSQSGQVVFFGSPARWSAAVLAPRVLEAIRAERVSTVTRWSPAECGWARFQVDVAGWGDESEVPGFVTSEDGSETVGRNVPFDGVAALWRPGCTLRIEVSAPRLSEELQRALTAAIPKEIAGGFVPTEPAITLGEHDVWECTENERGTYFGRPAFSLGIFGYGTPNDWKEYRRRVFAVPEVRALKARLEEVAGPMEECVYWYA